MELSDNLKYALSLKNNLNISDEYLNNFSNFSDEELSKIAYLDLFEEISSNINYSSWCDEVFKRIQNDSLTEKKPLTENAAFHISMCLMKYKFDQYKTVAKTNECYNFLGAPMNEPKHLWFLLHHSD